MLNETLTHEKMINYYRFQSTMTYLVFSQYYDLFNKCLKVESSIDFGIYCRDVNNEPISEEMIDKLNESIKYFLKQDKCEIEEMDMKREDLLEHFSKNNMISKVNILKKFEEDFIKCVKIGNFIDYILEPVISDKSALSNVKIMPLFNGLIICFTGIFKQDEDNNIYKFGKIVNLFNEYAEWTKKIDCQYASNLNELIFNKKINDIKWVSEGLHDNKLEIIAEYLISNFKQRKIISISGPLSCSKSSFARKLRIALLVNGYGSKILKMRDLIGSESLANTDFVALGRSVLSKVKEDEFLIVHGVYGSNPKFIDVIGKDKVTTIYVTTLTPIHIDESHRIPNSDIRLIRTILLEFRKFRKSPRETIEGWARLRDFEEKHVLPYQENADFFFNNALVHELPSYVIECKTLLAEAAFPESNVDTDSNTLDEVQYTARRLFKLLDVFYPLPGHFVPHSSFIRDYIGGSDFKT